MADDLHQVQKILSSMQKSLECRICLDLFVSPSQTRCGHTFCTSCLQRLTKKTAPCPLCNTKLTRRSYNPDWQAAALSTALRRLIDAVRQDTGVNVSPSKYRPRPSIEAAGASAEHAEPKTIKKPHIKNVRVAGESGAGGGRGHRRPPPRHVYTSRRAAAAEDDLEDLSASQVMEFAGERVGKAVEPPPPPLLPADNRRVSSKTRVKDWLGEATAAGFGITTAESPGVVKLDQTIEADKENLKRRLEEEKSRLGTAITEITEPPAEDEDKENRRGSTEAIIAGENKKVVEESVIDAESVKQLLPAAIQNHPSPTQVGQKRFFKTHTANGDTSREQTQTETETQTMSTAPDGAQDEDPYNFISSQRTPPKKKKKARAGKGGKGNAAAKKLALTKKHAEETPSTVPDFDDIAEGATATRRRALPRRAARETVKKAANTAAALMTDDDLLLSQESGADSDFAPPVKKRTRRAGKPGSTAAVKQPPPPKLLLARASLGTASQEVREINRLFEEAAGEAGTAPETPKADIMTHEKSMHLMLNEKAGDVTTPKSVTFNDNVDVKEFAAMEELTPNKEEVVLSAGKSGRDVPHAVAKTNATQNKTYLQNQSARNTSDQTNGTPVRRTSTENGEPPHPSTANNSPSVTNADSAAAQRGSPGWSRLPRMKTSFGVKGALDVHGGGRTPVKEQPVSEAVASAIQKLPDEPSEGRIEEPATTASSESDAPESNGFTISQRELSGKRVHKYHQALQQIEGEVLAQETELAVASGVDIPPVAETEQAETAMDQQDTEIPNLEQAGQDRDEGGNDHAGAPGDPPALPAMSPAISPTKRRSKSPGGRSSTKARPSVTMSVMETQPVPPLNESVNPEPANSEPQPANSETQAANSELPRSEQPRSGASVLASESVIPDSEPQRSALNRNSRGRASLPRMDSTDFVTEELRQPGVAGSRGRSDGGVKGARHAAVSPRAAAETRRVESPVRSPGPPALSQSGVASATVRGGGWRRRGPGRARQRHWYRRLLRGQRRITTLLTSLVTQVAHVLPRLAADCKQGGLPVLASAPSVAGASQLPNSSPPFSPTARRDSTPPPAELAGQTPAPQVLGDRVTEGGSDPTKERWSAEDAPNVEEAAASIAENIPSVVVTEASPHRQTSEDGKQRPASSGGKTSKESSQRRGSRSSKDAPSRRETRSSRGSSRRDADGGTDADAVPPSQSSHPSSPPGFMTALMREDPAPPAPTPTPPTASAAESEEIPQLSFTQWERVAGDVAAEMRQQTPPRDLCDVDTEEVDEYLAVYSPGVKSPAKKTPMRSTAEKSPVTRPLTATSVKSPTSPLRAAKSPLNSPSMKSPSRRSGRLSGRSARGSDTSGVKNSIQRASPMKNTPVRASPVGSASPAGSIKRRSHAGIRFDTEQSSRSGKKRRTESNASQTRDSTREHAEKAASHEMMGEDFIPDGLNDQENVSPGREETIVIEDDDGNNDIPSQEAEEIVDRPDEGATPAWLDSPVRREPAHRVSGRRVARISDDENDEAPAAPAQLELQTAALEEKREFESDSEDHRELERLAAMPTDQFIQELRGNAEPDRKEDDEADKVDDEDISDGLSDEDSLDPEMKEKIEEEPGLEPIDEEPTPQPLDESVRVVRKISRPRISSAGSARSRASAVTKIPTPEEHRYSAGSRKSDRDLAGDRERTPPGSQDSDLVVISSAEEPAQAETSRRVAQLDTVLVTPTGGRRSGMASSAASTATKRSGSLKLSGGRALATRGGVVVDTPNIPEHECVVRTEILGEDVTSADKEVPPLSRRSEGCSSPRKFSTPELNSPAKQSQIGGPADTPRSVVQTVSSPPSARGNGASKTPKLTTIVRAAVGTPIAVASNTPKPSATTANSESDTAPQPESDLVSASPSETPVRHCGLPPRRRISILSPGDAIGSEVASSQDLIIPAGFFNDSSLCVSVDGEAVLKSAQPTLPTSPTLRQELLSAETKPHSPVARVKASSSSTAAAVKLLDPTIDATTNAAQFPDPPIDATTNAAQLPDPPIDATTNAAQLPDPPIDDAVVEVVSDTGSEDMFCASRPTESAAAADRTAPSPPPPVLIASGLKRGELDAAQSLASAHGGRFLKQWSPDVTHVVVKTGDNLEAGRTLKFLQGVAARVWLVSHAWVTACLSAGKLLPEAPYEAIDAATGEPGPQRSRTSGGALFADFVFCCIEPFRDVTLEQLEALIRQCGGAVVATPGALTPPCPRRIRLIVAQEDCEHDLAGWWRHLAVPGVSYEWLIDCVATQRLWSLLDNTLCGASVAELVAAGVPDELCQPETQTETEYFDTMGL